MQSTGYLVVTLAATLSFSFTGAMAQAATAADAAAQAQAARQNAITDRYLTTVQVEMAVKVDTAKAAVGQEFSAKTLAEAKLADDTVLPKGTRLVGHIIQLRAGGAEQGSAVLTLVLDHAEVKPGQSIPVRCVIRAVAPNAKPAAQDRSVMMAPQMSGPAPMGRGGVAGGMPGTVPAIGGGIGGVGPVGGSNIPNVGMPGQGGGAQGTPGTGIPDGSTRGSTAPSIGDPGPAIGGPTAYPGSMGGTPSDMGGRKVMDAGESLSGAPRATGLPGVMLWAAPTASGTLTSNGRPITLDVGMQMTLGVITR